MCKGEIDVDGGQVKETGREVNKILVVICKYFFI